MLTFTPMKNLAGIRLEGDYLTLRSIHESVHQAVTMTSLPTKDEETLLGLAYDLRKAYERQRDVIKPPKHYEEIGVRYGVKIIWSNLLVQSRQLRAALAWGPNTSMQQACTFALEALIESAIADQFGEQAPDILRRWRNLNTDNTQGIFRHYLPVGAMFCSWTKAERKARFQAMLVALNGPSDVMHDHATRNGIYSISPADMEAWRDRDWCDPETGK